MINEGENRVSVRLKGKVVNKEGTSWVLSKRKDKEKDIKEETPETPALKNRIKQGIKQI